MELSNTQKELVGRGALLVMGLMLLYGGWRCMSVAADMREDFRKEKPDASLRQTRRGSGAGLPSMIGFVLLAGGGMLSLGAVLPTGTFEKMFARAPKNVGIGQGRSWHDWK